MTPPALNPQLNSAQNISCDANGKKRMIYEFLFFFTNKSIFVRRTDDEFMLFIQSNYTNGMSYKLH
jgi:hypothetical protein